MIKKLGLSWDSLLEVAPHLLLAAASAVLITVTQEGRVTASAPMWSQATFGLAVIALIPLCFVSGLRFRRWPKRGANAALLALNGAMAALCGVSVGALGLALNLEWASSLIGEIGFIELFRFVALTGGLLGALSYAAGFASRRRIAARV
jgi:hypothetical protein